jgi:predicted dehydrogenase
MRSLLLGVLCVGVLILGACSPTASRVGAVGETGGEALPAPKLSSQTGPLRIAVAGLVHGHVEGLLYRASQNTDVKLVGIYEPNRALFDRLAKKYNVDPSLYHADLGAMLDATKPEAVSVMSAIDDHVRIAEQCAPRGVHMLMEKPLAFSRADGQALWSLSAKHRVLILTNFETSWYASVRESARRVRSGERAPIRHMVFRHGHKGPVEIGCSPEFLEWLTDPAQNGGGAVVDFGCYGAVLATWLMDGQRPTSVVASLSTTKPNVYPRVDDNATIILTYPGATATIQASWAWTHDNKEMDLHTERGSLHAAKWDSLTARDENQPPVVIKPAPMPEHLKDEWVYLRKVVRGQCEVDPLSSLELNVIVAEILDQARQSRQP